ncbi:unnamed protein product [Ceratitis capitata]|uniref:(Mediterranean fruit fly) hypothetical protein n=1 Tax=Ceratitis capitata TaxID=7213 RepID=A0A811U4L7_CERCA|nr:unnamed protein product [Ceratitis capitata]
MFPIRNESRRCNTRDKASTSAMNAGAVEKVQGSNQPAKLFDKKFVATALRNTRCCPKCRSEYSTNYDLRMGDLHVKSNRPFLLTCGHNMCENCIYQNHQNLVCSVCQLPIVIDRRNTPLSPSLTVHGTSQKQRNHHYRHENFNVRDFFYMNFFLIGELNHLRFYRRESSANNTLMIACGNEPLSPTSSGNRTLAPGIQLTPPAIFDRCSECEYEPAVGSCRQCSVNYCRICYDSIHMYGKALKRHTFVTLDKDQHMLRDMKNVRRNYCQYHKRLKDRFCDTCQIVCCPSCAKRDHQSHRWTTLGNENEAMQDEIANILESVKMSRENLRKAQKVSG